MKQILFFLFILQIIIYPQTGNVKGKITDGFVPIPYSNVLVVNSSLGAVSDENGFYRIEAIPVGEHTLRFSSVGFETKFIDINILPNKTLELDVVLLQAIFEVEEINITGFKTQEQNDTRTSFIDLNPRSAKILPGAGEDVLRTLQALPGVLAPSDFSSQLIVRGSGPDQNLIIMDDVEIFNPYRLYGVISMFNPDAVSDVNLISGGFPAKYGDRLSAVLDVTNREGTKKSPFAGSINASIIDANIVLEGKNPFNINGSWLINSRRTYYDLIVEPFVKNAGLVDENVTFPNFYDLQGKLVLGPFKGHKFLFNGIYSRDGVDVVSADDRKTADSIDVFNVTKNDVLSFAWHFSPNTKLLNKVIVSYYNNSGLTDFDSKILDPSLGRENFEDVIPDTLSPYLLGIKFNADFAYRKIAIDDKFTFIWGDNIFEAGAGMDLMRTSMKFNFELDPELAAIISANPQFNAVLSDIVDLKYYNRYRAYIQNNFAIGDNLFFHPGLRLDHYDILNKTYISPRISLSYAVNALTTIRAVWGIYYQSPGYEKLRDQGVLYDLNDRYTNNLNAEKAAHYVLGIERWLNSEWSFRVEGYYKDFSDLIDQKIVDGSRFYTEPIPGRDLRYSTGWTRPITLNGDSLTQIPVNNAFGEAYGLELFLSKKDITEGNLSGWIAYSLAYADRNENLQNLPFRFDQRHTVNVVLNYRFNSWFDVGLRWQYGSGFPITEPVGIKPRIILKDYNADGIPETPEISTRRKITEPNTREVIYDVDFGDNKFTSRKPPYHRLDIRFTALADYWGLDWAFYLDVINAYNRSNVINYDYFITEDLQLDRRANNMFPIIPTLGFSVKF